MSTCYICSYEELGTVIRGIDKEEYLMIILGYFFLFLQKNICCGNPLEVPQQFLLKNMFWVLIRSILPRYCVLFKYMYCSLSTPLSYPRIIIKCSSWNLVLLNKLRCHTHFKFSANQITWSRLLIQNLILNGKQCRSRSVGIFRSQLIWIYTVCKDRTYLGSAGLGWSSLNLHDCIDVFEKFTYSSR